MNHPNNNEATPWYRQFWPWLLIAILGWGIVSSLITLSVALGNPPQMMTGDYQRLGKLLIDTHARADRAEALGLRGRMARRDGRWRLDLESRAALATEPLLLLILHPTDAGRDRQLVLKRASAGRWTSDGDTLTLFPQGRLIVSDLAQTWWISGKYEAAPDGELEATLTPQRL